MKNKGTKPKSKKKGSENAFGCDLIEHLQISGQDVPQVLKKCAEFIEKYGIVDGIYRLSGVTSNIQRLRQEFCSELSPDLTKEVYLQDIHCVGSLCKLYFRELPNPLLTYELYSKFTEAVSVQGDHERLLYLQRLIKELPNPHFRTLEYLTKHLAHLATLSTHTNMHTRNLALVWAPNLLRSKDIEASSVNGDMAFQEVRIQQSVIEFILNHTEQIFSSEYVQIKPKEGMTLLCGEKYATLPISGQCGPMKLMSLEEAQARSLSPNHPLHKDRQRENSLPDTNTATLYHTVIDISDSKRKFSGKSKKWKSIFNLGRSVDSKGKLSRNGSVFIRAQGITEKAALRPSRSMESLCSLTTDDEKTRHNSPAGGPSSIFVSDVKSRTLGSDSLCDISERDKNWEPKGKQASEATGGWSSPLNQKGSPGSSAAPQKTLPEQLKVFKGDEVSSYKPTSPKNRRMLYSSSSNNNSSRPSFPGSFFPLESSPRHQRRAINISEPFAVSVPLRVSAVISSNSTPCRGHAKDKATTLKPCNENSEPSRNSGKSNTFPQLEPKRQEGTEKKRIQQLTSRVPPDDTSKEVASQVHNQSIAIKLITEINLLDETFKPVFGSNSAPFEHAKLTVDVKSKRSRSSPSLSLLCREQSSSTSLVDPATATGSDFAKKQPSESDISFSLHKSLDVIVGGSTEIAPSAVLKDKKDRKQNIKHSNTDDPGYNKQAKNPLKETCLDKVTNSLTTQDTPTVGGFSGANDTNKSQKHEILQEDKKITCDSAKQSVVSELKVLQRLSLCAEDRPNTLEIPNLDDDEGCAGNLEELDLEPWEDLSSTKQWVTSPLHSPDVEELLNHLSPITSCRETLSSEERKISSPPVDNNRQSDIKNPEGSTGHIPQTLSSQPETKWMYLPSVPVRVNVNHNNATQPHKCNTTKQKNTGSSHRFYRQMSYESAASEKREENYFAKHRPYSLNLDLGYRCIRDISNQQDRNSSEFSSCQRGLQASSGAVSNGLPSELELFLNDRQAPLRRNSAPVSVSSVRTAFMIKTCQAKAVPVVPPKVQYSQIPHSRHEKDIDTVKEQEKEHPKMSKEKSSAAPPPLMMMSDLNEELENKEPAPKHQKHPNVEKSAESVKTTPCPELPVIKRRHPPSLEVFVDCPRPNRGNLLQRPSFRNRQRPQSLILLSPPFPIMDYPPSGDDGKLLSSIKSINDTSAVNVFSKDTGENFRTQDGITLQNKMTIPKSGQRLETSTSCFYQPQRRSMIFDSRSHRQIE
ncbi:Rho GTPase-activating protein 31 Cdc42 GTPase-activating protein [Channa argus]|uniref:Rho GTPase-activating protein 31 Cdc42 GTPase-activating protein n=1 Tax=Channa argus TaxID=215402 RepID=A0A6G1QVX2_CHAAH|nr:Rho GTPase-activating protein 31 Cdc42 GTPase-activating protein [Channa argus]